MIYRIAVAGVYNHETVRAVVVEAVAGTPGKKTVVRPYKGYHYIEIANAAAAQAFARLMLERYDVVCEEVEELPGTARVIKTVSAPDPFDEIYEFLNKH